MCTSGLLAREKMQCAQWPINEMKSILRKRKLSLKKSKHFFYKEKKSLQSKWDRQSHAFDSLKQNLLAYAVQDGFNQWRKRGLEERI